MKELQKENLGKTVLQPQVGDYCKGEETNITLPMEYNQIKSLSILDSGVEATISTKDIWEAQEKLAIRRTKMKLQLADGHLARPMGLLE